MSFWIVVTGLEIYDKTKNLEFKRHGFKSTRNKLVQKIASGDCLIFYITGKKQFAGIVEVTSEVIYDDSRVWQSKKSVKKKLVVAEELQFLIFADLFCHQQLSGSVGAL